MGHGGELFNYPGVIVFMYWYHRSNLCPFKGLSRGQKQLNLKSNSNTWMILSICLTLGNHTFYSQREDYNKYLMHQAHGSYKANISFFYFYFHFPESSSHLHKTTTTTATKRKSTYCLGKSSLPTKYLPIFIYSALSFYQQEK